MTLLVPPHRHRAHSACRLHRLCLDGYPDRFFNTGIGLVQGWVDLDNDSPDALYSHCIEVGLRLYVGRLDYAFGRASKQYGEKIAPTHILMPLKGDIEKRKEVLPGAFYIDGEKHDTEFRYLSRSSKPGSTQHSVAPGPAHFNGDKVNAVVWTNLNTTTTAPLYEVDDVIRGVAAGQLIYTIVRHWTANRHHLAIPFTAILARAVSEGGAIFADRSHPLHSCSPLAGTPQWWHCGGSKLVVFGRKRQRGFEKLRRSVGAICRSLSFFFVYATS